MSFTKNDIENIKSKISIKSELEKKTRIIQKGRDYWCCCPFHDEKTPSCKINDDLGSYYCFGCGEKGDIFSLYTNLYNFNFIDAVKELSIKAGLNINFDSIQKTEKESNVEKILELSAHWFQKNLNLPLASICKEYLESRKLTKKTIEKFDLGYSYNSNLTLYKYLKTKSYSDEELLKSNIVKLDKNKKIVDYFYKRLIFPIKNNNGKILGFGGRSLNNSNPKYINSPESSFFQKRKLLYNLDLAKNSARKKNNLLICEGYMDVISLNQKGILSVVAPLGTALTEDQLNLAWKYSSKPSIMFDGDSAGVRASYKSAIMSLRLINPERFIQFINLPGEHDPDSYINNISFDKFLDFLKKPESLVDFIFNHSSKAISLDKADDKISYDKYLDDLVDMIVDKKIQYFYKSEFKNLFFKKIRNNKHFSILPNNNKNQKLNLNVKQNLSFIASVINNREYRNKILDELLNSELLDKIQKKILTEIRKNKFINLNNEEIIKEFKDISDSKLIKESLSIGIYKLFPYSGPKFDPHRSYEEVLKSIKNLNTRLLNLQKINKSLDTFVKNSNSLNWSELQSINIEIIDEN